MKTIPQIERQSTWTVGDLADYLTRWNEWRRGDFTPMCTPHILGEIIDASVEALLELERLKKKSG